MFTGIVESVGTVERVERHGSTQRTTLRAPEILNDAALGDSIAFDGETFQFDSVEETLRLTTIGTWEQGRRVNVERSLQVGARLGGHWVMGHVDGIARIVERRDDGGSAEITLEAPESVTGQIARKGSVALDGISLTVTEVDGARFGVAVIPFTLDHTTLGGKRPGDAIHLETDVLAKYVERLMGAAEAAPRDHATMALLEQAGFLSSGRP